MINLVGKTLCKQYKHLYLLHIGGRKAFLNAYPEFNFKVSEMPHDSAIIFRRALESTVQDGIDITKNDINENATVNLINYKPIAWKTVDKSYHTSIGDFQTLIHGDSWQNNAMFRYRIVL